MQITKLRQVGNSLGVTLPANIITQMKLTKGQELHVTYDASGALVLRKLSVKGKELLERGDALINQHYEAMKGLGNE